jgi:hypothetical protein
MLALLLLAAATTADAATIQVPHGLTGAWWDPALNGQGLLLEEMESPTNPAAPNSVTGFWFTYDDQGRPLYLVGSGEYRGGKIVMDVVTTTGGRHGSDLVAAQVQRTAWGQVEIIPQSCSSLRITYRKNGQANTGTVAFTRFADALGMTTHNQICEVVPEEFTPPLASQLTVQSCDGFFGCSNVSLPYSATTSVNTSVVGSRPPNYTVRQFRITPTNGDAVVSYVGSEDSHPITRALITGVSEGQRIAQGETVVVTLATDWTSNVTEQLRFKVGLTYQGFTGSAGNLSIDYRASVRTN